MISKRPSPSPRLSPRLHLRRGWKRWGWALALALLLLSQGSCLQFVPVIPEDQQNSYPNILENGLDPPQLQVIIPRTQDPGGKKVFRVGRVVEADPQDTLYAYWFLGYEQFPETSLRCQFAAPPSSTTTSTANNIRKVEFTCRINHNDVLLQPGQVIALELFVVDRQADLGSILNSNGVRQWPANTEPDSRVWLLRVE